MNPIQVVVQMKSIPTRSPKVRCMQRAYRPGRQFIVVDIENVIGGAAERADEIVWARDVVTSAVNVEEDDHVVIGMDHRGLLPVACAWGGPRYVFGRGVDGADLALLRVLDENLAERFDHVVVVSGDGIFSDAVASLGARGVSVTVAAHRRGLSRRLQMAASQVIYFDTQAAAAVPARRAA